MSKKSIALLTIFLLSSIAFIFIKFKYAPLTAPTESLSQASPTPTSEDILSLSPNPITALSGKASSADIVLEIHGNAPTLIQLEIGYDPDLLADVSIVPSDFFANPTILLNNINPRTGRISYAIKPESQQTLANRTGTIATIMFTPVSIFTKPTTLSFLPKTVIYENGEQNRLKVGYGATILINPGVAMPQASNSAGF